MLIRSYGPANRRTRFPLHTQHKLAIVALAVLLAGMALHTSGVLFPATNVQVVPGLSPDPGKLPLSFEPNAGQTDPTVRFQAHVPGGALFFTPSEVVLSLAAHGPNSEDAGSGSATHRPDSGYAAERTFGPLATNASLASDRGKRSLDDPGGPPGGHTGAQPPPSIVRMQFMGANPSTGITGTERLPGIVNYFLGNDPARWRTNLPTYGAISYEELYPGIDLHYSGKGGLLKGTYTLAPGADPGLIRWRYEGADKARLDAEGNLQVAPLGGGAGTLTEQAPVAWQEIGGQRVAVGVGFDVASDGSAGFVLGSYDLSRSLTLDPAVIYSTYLGGSGDDLGYGIAVDGQGNVYVTGSTESNNFPTANPFQPNRVGRADAFVTKFSASGSSLLYSTYLGGTGSGLEVGYGIAVDGQGNAYVTGLTSSTDFPTANPFQPSLSGDQDAFVTKFNASGSTLLYSTYLGGGGTGRDGDTGEGIAVDGQGNAYVTGLTNSTDFPTASPFQPSLAGNQDAFVTKFSASGSTLLYSTYLGGSNFDFGAGIAVDGQGNAYVTGDTFSNNFPTANPFQPSLSGPYDAFVTKFSASGSTLLYSTYLGGNGNEAGYGIAVDGQGNAYVTGYTYSTNFPTANPFQPSLSGSKDAFVTKFSASGSTLLYSTYLGGGISRDGDNGEGIAVDGQGNAYVTGLTSSTDFPTANPFQPSLAGLGDAFVTKFNASGSTLLYSTYLGGTDYDFVRGIAVDTQGNAYVTGLTSSTDFPVQNSFQSTYGGGMYEAFVTKIDGLAGVPPTPVPAPVANGGAPKVGGAILVWDHDRPASATGDIRAEDLEIGRVITVTDDPADHRHPSVSGNLIVWQQRSSSGDWDIYGARIGFGVVSGPTPIYVAPGDQVNPAVSRDLVVWQSSGQALGTATPESTTRWDVVGEDLSTPSNQPFTLTTGTTTNRNPSIDSYFDSSSSSLVSVAAWQSTIPTTTLLTPQPTPWAIQGATQVGPRALLFTVPPGHGDQTNPSVSGCRVVWQELHSTSQVQDPSVHGRWNVPGYDHCRHATFSVTQPFIDPGDQTLPAISGNRVVYQDDPIDAIDAIVSAKSGESPLSHGRWNIVQRELNNTNAVIDTITVTTYLTSTPAPAISADHIVWQQATSPGNAIPVLAGSDVWGNVGAGGTPTSTPTPIATATRTATLIPMSFTDVQPSDYFYEPVRVLYGRGVISGYNDNTFKPYNLTTRGQLCKIVALAEGWSIYTPIMSTFQDVSSTDAFYRYIETAYHQGIISGYDCGTGCLEFRPGNNVTRGQLCKIVVLAQGWTLYTLPTPTFSDVPDSHPFYQYVETAYSHSIISGYGCGSGCLEFRPGNNATRGQICKIVYQAVTAP